MTLRSHCALRRACSERVSTILILNTVIRTYGEQVVRLALLYQFS